ncbi:MAG TPA: hypothetical protein P5556_04055 [Candidatus Gastranaerophilales bacterium]|nr:hypothetical protein [Candidatus Gastranaerophilales bacterium]
MINAVSFGNITNNATKTLPRVVMTNPCIAKPYPKPEFQPKTATLPPVVMTQPFIAKPYPKPSVNNNPHKV